MSLLIPAIAGAGAWLYTAQALSWKQRLTNKNEINTDDLSRKAPVEGYYQPYHRVAQSLDVQRGRFRSVREGVDERGAKCFFVQYSDGARTIQYHDPRQQL